MNKHYKQSGFILVLTTMILSIAIIIVSQLVNKGMLSISFDKTVIEREKAKLLAQSGVQIAMSQLSIDLTSSSTAQKPTPEASKQVSLKLNEFLEKIFISLNRWQKVILKKDTDGIDGEINFCVVCENGKIPLNEIFDFEKKKFINEGAAQGDVKKALKEVFLAMKKFTNDKDLFDTFEKILKQRQYKFNDPTELLNDKEFAKAFKTKVFYEPPRSSMEEAEKLRAIYLTDIFTVFSQGALQPWFLSDSLQGILMLKRAQSDDIKQRTELVKQLLKEKPINTFSSISSLWDTYLQRFYGKDFKSIPSEITSTFTLKFEPSSFSVLSYGIVGNITQKIVAVIERVKSSDTHTFIIKKMYWI